MSELTKQAKKALTQKEKVVEMFKEKYSKELSKLPSGTETDETDEILRYLTGIYIRKNRINYQLEKAVMPEDERIIFEDLFREVFL